MREGTRGVVPSTFLAFHLWRAGLPGLPLVQWSVWRQNELIKRNGDHSRLPSDRPHTQCPPLVSSLEQEG